MLIDAKLHDVEAWGGESTQLPPGQYDFLIKAANVEAKSEGKNQLVIDNEVISAGEFKEKIQKSYFMLDFTKDTPRKRLKSLVSATGCPVDGAGNFDTNGLLGTRYTADVIHETYQSKPDPITGQTSEKTAVRIVNERRLGSTNGATATASTGGQVKVGGMAGLTPAE